jgi:hypothetical protein
LLEARKKKNYAGGEDCTSSFDTDTKVREMAIGSVLFPKKTVYTTMPRWQDEKKLFI